MIDNNCKLFKQINKKYKFSHNNNLHRIAFIFLAIWIGKKSKDRASKGSEIEQFMVVHTLHKPFINKYFFNRKMNFYKYFSKILQILLIYMSYWHFYFSTAPKIYQKYFTIKVLFIIEIYLKTRIETHTETE